VSSERVVVLCVERELLYCELRENCCVVSSERVVVL